MTKCKNCGCNCHCSLEEHSDMYGVCSCSACMCKKQNDKSKVNIVREKVFGGVTVVDDTGECETCQQIQKNVVVRTQKKKKTTASAVKQKKKTTRKR